jgi:hypothetical protein
MQPDSFAKCGSLRINRMLISLARPFIAIQKLRIFWANDNCVAFCDFTEAMITAFTDIHLL